MITAILVSLIGLCGYLAARLHAANTENSALRASVAQLKRRIGKLS
jgi:hypothetical protein